VQLAISSGLFAEDEAEVVRTLMDDFFARTKADGHGCLVDVDDDLDGDVAAGVAYFQPVAATDGTWTLLMIAVRAEQQGQGRGSVLLSEVENQLRRQQQRLLLVETSGVPDFALTRAFYDKAGYGVEARVRDYYAAGDDMVLYRKALAEPSGT
jgi:ribosomal protein S18 acetylase RimI-like enzyme